MEPLLTKEEINELLSAIEDGHITTDQNADACITGSHQLSFVNIDLFRTVEPVREGAEERIPNVDLLLDTFARIFSITLTKQLQRTFVVEREELTITSFEESLKSLNNQGAAGVFSMDPLKHSCLFHVDPPLSFTLLEIMLGAPPVSDSLSPNRALTLIEMSVLQQTMLSLGEDLQRTFKQVREIQVTLLKVENNFRLLNIVEGDHEVLMTVFNLKVGGQQVGHMRFIIPALTLEPLKKTLREIVTIAHTENNWSRQMAEEALEMDTLVIARSGLLQMSVRQILDLREGDIVNLGYAPQGPLTIMVEDQPKFTGIPGERNGKKTVHINALKRKP
ncbi:MAG: hypothetical protein CSA34_01200 [Desulfobulbus propionicus]|nr:MAG: hypothetical protein CSA34_01200 [Desulfobulbus propionicus]